MLFTKKLRDRKGQAMTELALILPLLLVMGLGAIEVSNMIDTYLAITHLSREGANLTSRDRNLTEQRIQDALTAVINAAKPTFCEDGDGCNQNAQQWYVIYSQIVYDPGAGTCGSSLNSGDADSYHIRRMDSWDRGGFVQTSKIGNDGDCAELEVPNIKGMAPNQTFHVIEVFFNYAPSTLTPLENVMDIVLPDLFYDKSIFTQV